MALPLVAYFCGGDSGGAGADVGRAVLLTRVVQVAGFGGIQAVILSGHRRFAYRHKDMKVEGTRKQEPSMDMSTKLWR